MMTSFLTRWRSPSRSTARHTASARVNRYVLISLAVPLFLLLVVPLAALLLRVPTTTLLQHVRSEPVVRALTLSLVTSTLSTLVVIALGTPLAYVLVRQRIRGHRLLEVLVDLPTVLPPAVAGLALLMAFGRRGLLGGSLRSLGIELAFTTGAVLVAQVFVSTSLYVKTAGVGLAAINPELEQAAALDGAHGLQIFRHITLPLAWRGMLGGAALAWTRALGEFGATIIFAGNFPGRTQTMALLVYLSFEVDLAVALTLAAIMLLICLCILVLVRLLLHRVDEDY